MRPAIIILLSISLLLSFAAGVTAYHETEMKAAVLKMSDEEQIELAESAAPSSVSKKATIMILDKELEYKRVRTGTNGFICYSDLDKIDRAVPSCMNAAAVQWWNDFTSGRPGPTNTVPGIAYMAQGALRWEKDGRIYMDWHTPGANRIEEPPHWLILWPFNTESTKLPVYPGEFGSYIMYDGTPWSHLMIYQDPMKMGR